MAGVDVTIVVVVDDTVGITGAVFTADERVKAERLSQTDVAVGSSDARWTHTLTTDRITQSTSTLTACTHTTMLLHGNASMALQDWQDIHKQ